MQPNRLGRVLGITTRLAAGKIREQAAKIGEPPAPGTGASPGTNSGPTAGVRPGVGGGRTVGAQAETRAAATGPSAGAAVADGGRRLLRGAGRFGSAMAKPLAHAGGILVLQVTGAFFGIFAAFFLSHAWQTGRATRWHDRHAEVYLGLGLLFVWFAVSSFWRARRKQRG